MLFHSRFVTKFLSRKPLTSYITELLSIKISFTLIFLKVSWATAKMTASYFLFGILLYTFKLYSL